MRTAGQAVLVSALAVALGVLLVTIVPVPFIRSLGVAGAVVPVVSVVATLTLQPVLLSLFGSSISRSARRPLRTGRPAQTMRFWPRLARLVAGHPVAVLALSVSALLVLALPVGGLQLTPGSVSAVPHDMSSDRGLELLGERAGLGVETPVQVVLATSAARRALSPAVSAAVLRFARQLLGDPQVFVVAIGSRPPYVDTSGRYRLISVVAEGSFGDAPTQQLVQRIRAQLVPAAGFPAGTRVFVGGAPAEGVDFLSRVYGAFPWVVGLMLAVAYVVMLRAFRSLVLPLAAVLLNALSTAATYGLIVAVFRWGIGSDLFGLYRVRQVEGWVPVFLFAVLFSLSVDYQFFFVRRMRESWDQRADNVRAVTEGLARTGRVVSAAAMTMVAALLGLAAGHVAGLQELGTGLALGAALDATVVRGVLMPSLMVLLGRWNWWLPAPVARLFFVAPSLLASLPP
jgi:uncharacterized membrane protein YdfJ with MMPL/SSD domain